MMAEPRDATDAARLQRLLSICRRIRWTEYARPALSDPRTDRAIEDLFLFMAGDAMARALADPSPQPPKTTETIP